MVVQEEGLTAESTRGKSSSETCHGNSHGHDPLEGGRPVQGVADVFRYPDDQVWIVCGTRPLVVMSQYIWTDASLITNKTEEGKGVGCAGLQLLGIGRVHSGDDERE